MISSPGFADELNLEIWKNALSPHFLSFLISEMETLQQALQTQAPKGGRQAMEMSERMSGWEKSSRDWSGPR